MLRKEMQDMPRQGPALSSIRVLRYEMHPSTPDFTRVIGYLTNVEVLCLHDSSEKVRIPLEPFYSSPKINSIRSVSSMWHFGD